MNKHEERDFVEKTAKMLDEPWEIENRERPDFMITRGKYRFGLEVSELFDGPEPKLAPFSPESADFWLIFAFPDFFLLFINWL